MIKCLEPKRACCDLCVNKSKILNLKDAYKKDYKPIYEIKYVVEKCPSNDKCKIKSREYREGICFITKSKEVYEKEQSR